MDYDKYSDEELIKRYHNGEKAIMGYMLEKYKGITKNLASSMYILGAERDDLIQEGMIGLYKAVDDYKTGHNASFKTFAYSCVSKSMYTAIESANRLKHAALNSYDSIYDEDFQQEGSVNPEQEVLDKERLEDFAKYLDENLSTFEKQVFELKATGMDYKEIAAILEKSPKSVDNATNRLKTKIKQFFV